jgi:hypothetical protein
VTADTTTASALDDADARRRILTELDRTFVEAAAVLAKRQLRLDASSTRWRRQSHHGPAGGHHVHRSRGRGLRTGAGSVERAAANSSRAPDEHARCRRAVEEITWRDLDHPRVRGQLLRTFPLEAGLPPGFAMLDEIQQALASPSASTPGSGETHCRSRCARC